MINIKISYAFQNEKKTDLYQLTSFLIPSSECKHLHIFCKQFYFLSPVILSNMKMQQNTIRFFLYMCSGGGGGDGFEREITYPCKIKVRFILTTQTIVCNLQPHKHIHQSYLLCSVHSFLNHVHEAWTRFTITFQRTKSLYKKTVSNIINPVTKSSNPNVLWNILFIYFIVSPKWGHKYN